MPKPIDYIRKYGNVFTTILTAFYPVIGGVVGVVKTILIKPTKKVKTMINGKKAYTGIIITVLAFVAKLLGYDVPIETADGLTTSLNEIIMSVSTGLALIGGVHKIEKATKK